MVLTRRSPRPRSGRSPLRTRPPPWPRSRSCVVASPSPSGDDGLALKAAGDAARAGALAYHQGFPMKSSLALVLLLLAACQHPHARAAGHRNGPELIEAGPGPADAVV